ncbi:MAG TPA: hypothetical protein VEQ58_20710 [Polyangiaceae bacterium]|nr:hypothetical protein [Polyangiaceae bacterium]
MRGPLQHKRVWLAALLGAAGALGCSDPLRLGNDLLWSADQETGDLEQWTRDGQGQALEPRTPEPDGASGMPATDSNIDVSTEVAHRGNHSVKIVNPTGWEQDFDGPELYHVLGQLSDAYYSAWFLLPEAYRLEPQLTLMRLRSRDVGGSELFNGEELQLRSLSSGGYVLQVFSNNNGFLLEPIADPAPHVQSGRWFQLEARYEPQSSGRLRIWLDGNLVYDLSGRPGATGAELVLSVCNVAQAATPAPVVLFVDDVAVSLSRVSPTGKL